MDRMWVQAYQERRLAMATYAHARSGTSQSVLVGISRGHALVLSVGGQADANIPVCSLEALPENHIARRRSRKATSTSRLLSSFQRGRLILLTSFIAQRKLPLGCFIPEPWPP